MRERIFWTVLLLASQVAQGYAQQELRIEPRDEVIEYSWEQWVEIRDELCPEQSALYWPIETVGQSCRPRGVICEYDEDCCSDVCRKWRCR